MSMEVPTGNRERVLVVTLRKFSGSSLDNHVPVKLHKQKGQVEISLLGVGYTATNHMYCGEEFN